MIEQTSASLSAMNDHPATGRAKHLVRFLACLYNGKDQLFDLARPLQAGVQRPLRADKFLLLCSQCSLSHIPK
jgi:hypothetical protein